MKKENVLRFSVESKAEAISNIKKEDKIILKSINDKIIIETEQNINIGNVPDIFSKLISDSMEDDIASAVIDDISKENENYVLSVVFNFDDHKVDKKEDEHKDINTHENKTDNINENNNKNNGNVFAIPLIIIGCFVGAMLIASFFRSKDDIQKESELSDTTEIENTVTNRKPIVINRINKDSIIKVMRNDFKFKKDEFEEGDCMWVMPMSAAKYRNMNRLFLYFALNNGHAENLRVVLQYTASDWLFIQSCQFNVDGNVYMYVPSDMQTDNGIVGDDSRIWEWCDESLSSGDYSTFFNIGNASRVKMKLNGQQYSNKRNLTKSEIYYIKKTLEYYKKLGGKIE